MYITRSEELELLPRLGKREAIALIGPRQAGKTTLAKRMAQTWQARGKTAIFFDLEAIDAPNSALKLKKEIEKAPINSLVILDEVQNIDGWVKVAREQIEQKKRKLIITGSSAALLSAEVASSMAGRAIPYEILTLSYKDAVAWGIKGIGKYLEVGGYPECVLRPNDYKELHKTYFELTVLRDVGARIGAREIKPLRDLATIILSEPGKKISAAKTASRIGITQPTFRSYVQGLNDAFLVFSVPSWNRSPRERIVADAKHYAYDVGLATTVSASVERDYGRKIENLVALHLARQGYSLSYWSDGKSECDFIATKTGQTNIAVQVWADEGNPPQREIEGLKKAAKDTKSEMLFVCAGKPKNLEKDIKTKTIEEFLLEAENNG